MAEARLIHFFEFQHCLHCKQMPRLAAYLNVTTLVGQNLVFSEGTAHGCLAIQSQISYVLLSIWFCIDRYSNLKQEEQYSRPIEQLAVLWQENRIKTSQEVDLYCFLSCERALSSVRFRSANKCLSF